MTDQQKNPFYCYSAECSSKNVILIERFKGVLVKPEDHISNDEHHTGIVVKCLDCNEITGFLLIPSGVVDKYPSDEE